MLSEAFNDFMERGGFMSDQCHIGINFKELHRENVLEKSEIVITDLETAGGIKKKIVHIIFTDEIKKLEPVLTALGFSRYCLCPLFSHRKCLSMEITPDTVWQTSSQPKHMAMFTAQLITEIRDPWFKIQENWETLGHIMKKQYGCELNGLLPVLCKKTEEK